MNLNDIQAFIAVVQKGTITEAAKQLHVTQPTLTHRIQLLETELKASLFLRSKGLRQIELTDAGKSFMPIAEKWERLWLEASDISTLSQRKTFSVTTSHSLSYYIMPFVYCRFIARNLPMSMNVSVFHSQEAYEAVESREIDLALITNSRYSKRVSAIPVLEEPMVLLCSEKSHLSGELHTISLPVEKGIYMEWTHEYALWHDYWFGSKRQIMESESIRLVERMIAESDYWAVVPLYVAASAVKNGGLKYLRLQNPPPNRVTYLLTLSPKHEYTDMLVEDLNAYIAELSPT